jgi:hypothetical protein
MKCRSVGRSVGREKRSERASEPLLLLVPTRRKSRREECNIDDADAAVTTREHESQKDSDSTCRGEQQRPRRGSRRYSRSRRSAVVARRRACKHRIRISSRTARLQAEDVLDAAGPAAAAVVPPGGTACALFVAGTGTAFGVGTAPAPAPLTKAGNHTSSACSNSASPAAYAAAAPGAAPGLVKRSTACTWPGWIVPKYVPGAGVVVGPGTVLFAMRWGAPGSVDATPSVRHGSTARTISLRRRREARAHARSPFVKSVRAGFAPHPASASTSATRGAGGSMPGKNAAHSASICAVVSNVVTMFSAADGSVVWKKPAGRGAA